jgi:hypothetical protein
VLGTSRPWRPLSLDALSDPEAAATPADLEGVIVLVERQLPQVGAARKYGRELCLRQAGQRSAVVGAFSGGSHEGLTLAEHWACAGGLRQLRGDFGKFAGV